MSSYFKTSMGVTSTLPSYTPATGGVKRVTTPAPTPSNTIKTVVTDKKTGQVIGTRYYVSSGSGSPSVRIPDKIVDSIKQTAQPKIVTQPKPQIISSGQSIFIKQPTQTFLQKSIQKEPEPKQSLFVRTTPESKAILTRSVQQSTRTLPTQDLVRPQDTKQIIDDSKIVQRTTDTQKVIDARKKLLDPTTRLVYFQAAQTIGISPTGQKDFLKEALTLKKLKDRETELQTIDSRTKDLEIKQKDILNKEKKLAKEVELFESEQEELKTEFGSFVSSWRAKDLEPTTSDLVLTEDQIKQYYSEAGLLEAKQLELQRKSSKLSKQIIDYEMLSLQEKKIVDEINLDIKKIDDKYNKITKPLQTFSILQESYDPYTRVAEDKFGYSITPSEYRYAPTQGKIGLSKLGTIPESISFYLDERQKKDSDLLKQPRFLTKPSDVDSLIAFEAQKSYRGIAFAPIDIGKNIGKIGESTVAFGTIGAIGGSTIGSGIPLIGTGVGFVAGGIAGLKTGFVAGSVGAITSETVGRVTGDVGTGEFAGLITGVGSGVVAGQYFFGKELAKRTVTTVGKTKLVSSKTFAMEEAYKQKLVDGTGFKTADALVSQKVSVPITSRIKPDTSVLGKAFTKIISKPTEKIISTITKKPFVFKPKTVSKELFFDVTMKTESSIVTKPFTQNLSPVKVSDVGKDWLARKTPSVFLSKTDYSGVITPKKIGVLSGTKEKILGLFGKKEVTGLVDGKINIKAPETKGIIDKLRGVKPIKGSVEDKGVIVPVLERQFGRGYTASLKDSAQLIKIQQGLSPKDPFGQQTLYADLVISKGTGFKPKLQVTQLVNNVDKYYGVSWSGFTKKLPLEKTVFVGKYVDDLTFFKPSFRLGSEQVKLLDSKSLVLGKGVKDLTVQEASAKLDLGFKQSKLDSTKVFGKGIKFDVKPKYSVDTTVYKQPGVDTPGYLKDSYGGGIVLSKGARIKGYDGAGYNESGLSATILTPKAGGYQTYSLLLDKPLVVSKPLRVDQAVKSSFSRVTDSFKDNYFKTGVVERIKTSVVPKIKVGYKPNLQYGIGLLGGLKTSYKLDTTEKLMTSIRPGVRSSYGLDFYPRTRFSLKDDVLLRFGSPTVLKQQELTLLDYKTETITRVQQPRPTPITTPIVPIIRIPISGTPPKEMPSFTSGYWDKKPREKVRVGELDNLFKVKSDFFRKFTTGETDLKATKQNIKLLKNIWATKGSFLSVVPTQKQLDALVKTKKVKA